MARYQRFTFMCNQNERETIATLAENLQRSKSDAVRFVILWAAKVMTTEKQISHPDEIRFPGLDKDQA